MQSSTRTAAGNTKSCQPGRIAGDLPCLRLSDHLTGFEGQSGVPAKYMFVQAPHLQHATPIPYCAGAAASPLRPVRPLPPSPCAGVPNRAGSKWLPASALSPRVVPSPVPTRECSPARYVQTRLRSPPKHHRQTPSATDPSLPRPRQHRGPGALHPRSPPTPLDLRLAATDVERMQGRAALCVCTFSAFIPSPQTPFHSLSCACIPCPQHTNHWATGMLGRLQLSPESVGLWRWAPNFLSRALSLGPMQPDPASSRIYAWRRSP